MWVRTNLSFSTALAIASVFSRRTRPGRAQGFIVGPRRPPEHRQGSLINTLERVRRAQEGAFRGIPASGRHEGVRICLARARPADNRFSRCYH
ncbi:hypothetical protein EDB84DRAFT_135395 [Lactarius hengduanensis]|nr:hypothetical protein EDB84DRAFT_135395 [Lactarius hengduanensis]